MGPLVLAVLLLAVLAAASHPTLSRSCVQGWHVVSVGARRAVARLRVTYGWGPSRQLASHDSWLARSPLGRRFMGHRGYQQVSASTGAAASCLPPARRISDACMQAELLQPACKSRSLCYLDTDFCRQCLCLTHWAVCCRDAQSCRAGGAAQAGCMT